MYEKSPGYSGNKESSGLLESRYGKTRADYRSVCEEGRLELVVNLIKTKRELLKVFLWPRRLYQAYYNVKTSFIILRCIWPIFH